MTFKLKAATLAIAVFAVLALASCGGGSSSTETEAESEAETTASSESTQAPASGEPAANATREPAERSVKIDISNYAYDPDPVRVQAGGKVIWLNEDSVAHTATADDGSFDTGEIDEGKLKSETFKQPGVYQYHCSIHPQMHGTIEVVEED